MTSPESDENQSSAPGDAADAVEVLEIDYYTDPLCCWSWAFEPQWRWLRFQYGDQIRWRYVMGGMLQDWSSFNDPINGVRGPTQMGTHWRQVSQMTAQPIDDLLWQDDPPTSSLPACGAVKAAARQGEARAERYLRRLREAVMLERRNIARRSVLTELAIDLAGVDERDDPLDLERFLNDLRSPEVAAALRDDLQITSDREIERFPTLRLRAGEGPPLVVTGYRPYEVLIAALSDAAPQLRPCRSAVDAVDYVRYWGSVTVQEVAQALDVEPETARRLLDAAVEAGELGKRGPMLYVGMTETVNTTSEEDDDERPDPYDG